MKILSKPKGNAEEYGRWSVNPYIGCPHGCLYCYLKSGPSGGYLGQPKAVLKKGIVSEAHAYHLAMAEIIEHKDEIICDGGLFMTFTSDPLNFDTHSLFCRIVRSSVKVDIPVTMLTKTDLIPPSLFLDEMIPSRYILGNLDKKKATNEILENCIGKNHLLSIGFTLTGHDELEPKAATNEERIRTIDFLKNNYPIAKGCHVWASIEPVIDFDASFRMIQQALDAGCEHFKIGLMTKNTKVCRHGFTLGGKTFEPYDPARCLAFVQDVMVATAGRATVYWKQSFREFIGGTEKHRLFSDDDLHRIFDDYPNAVSKDWSIFTHSPAALHRSVSGRTTTAPNINNKE